MTLTLRTLDDIADSIRSHWAATEADRFAIGRDLTEAYNLCSSETSFRSWFEGAQFPFSRPWARLLMQAAEREPEVKVELESQLSSSKTPNFEKAVHAVTHPQQEEEAPDMSAFPTIAGIEPAKVTEPSGYRALVRALDAVGDFNSEVMRLTSQSNTSDAQHERLRVAARRALKVARRIDVSRITLVIDTGDTDAP